MKRKEEIDTLVDCFDSLVLKSLYRYPTVCTYYRLNLEVCMQCRRPLSAQSLVHVTKADPRQDGVMLSGKTWKLNDWWRKSPNCEAWHQMIFEAGPGHKTGQWTTISQSMQ